MPVEDFTTYIEVEEAADIFSVAANKIDFTDIPMNESSYVYKDFGIGHFGNFSHLITFYFDSNNRGTVASLCAYAQQNEITDPGSIAGDAIFTYLSMGTTVTKIGITEIEGGAVGDNDLSSTLLLDVPYYLSISRNGSTYQALIYDDAGRTNLVDTIAITSVATTFRYNMAATTRKVPANTNRHITGYIENLNIKTAQYIEGVMRSILKDTTAVSNICSDRIYWHKTPQIVTLPCVVFFAVSDPHLPLYFDPTGARTKSGQRMFQFTCMSNNSIESLNLQQKVMDTLRWAEGTTYGFTIEIITIENMRQRFNPETEIYLNDVDAIVEYFEP